MRFYLVQRLELRKTPAASATGFDKYFALDYMGASEFEWGAVPKALKAMRAKPVSSQLLPVTINGRTRDVYLVTHDGNHLDAAKGLHTWGEGAAHGRPFYGKEASHFDYQFAGIEYPYDDTTAWWSLEDDVAFALDEENANALVAAFNSKPAS